jgi:hypothetical protein
MLDYHRIDNLELMAKYGANAWRLHNAYSTDFVWRVGLRLTCVSYRQLEQMESAMKQHVEKLKFEIGYASLNISLILTCLLYRADIDQLNRQRQSEQREAGQTMLSLETRFVPALLSIAECAIINAISVWWACRWGELISRNFQVQMGCAALEAEILLLQKQAESLCVHMHAWM